MFRLISAIDAKPESTSASAVQLKAAEALVQWSTGVRELWQPGWGQSACGVLTGRHSPRGLQSRCPSPRKVSFEERCYS